LFTPDCDLVTGAWQDSAGLHAQTVRGLSALRPYPTLAMLRGFGLTHGLHAALSSQTPAALLRYFPDQAFGPGREINIFLSGLFDSHTFRHNRIFC